MVNNRQYRFLHRGDDGTLWWVGPPVDSRHEHVQCSADWFYGMMTDGETNDSR